MKKIALATAALSTLIAGIALANSSLTGLGTASAQSIGNHAAVVPEVATMVLLGSGLLGLAGSARTKR